MDDATKAELLDELICDSEAKLERLRAELELEKRYLVDLRSRRATLGARVREATNEPIPELTGAMRPLPEAIQAVLQESAGPMRARDIAQRLVRNGYTSKAKHGLLPSVLSALGRRDDLFENVSRGVYRLKRAAKGER